MRYTPLIAIAALPLLTLPLPSHGQNLTVSAGDTLGAVSQTPAVDDFTMTGGTVQSLNQGEGYDTFNMSGGHIIGAFEDGDRAIFSGGRIGRVDLKLADNYFEMSQDTAVETRIDGNLVSGFGNDTLILRGGTIGGNISTSGGVDNITISGGSLRGNVLASAGDDVFNWSGGTLGGRVDMGLGNDQANISNLDTDTLTIVLDGGDGNDSLRFANSQVLGGTLYRNWEAISLADNSRLTLDDTLTLGDSNSGTGTLNLDASSVLLSRQGTVTAFNPSQPTMVINAGMLDLSGGNDAQGRLVINGNYQGNDGVLRVNSVLAGDNAPSDRLVVSQGTLSGRTQLLVNNLGGAGAATPQNGIQVVEARDGATSTATAFVQTQTLSAGAFDYRLFKGGVTAGSENSWFLRSTLVAAPPPAAQTPPVEEGTPGVAPAITPPVAAPAPGQAELPAPVAGESAPLYRPEVPVYAAAPRGAAIIARQALGTFHQRQGDQQLLSGQGGVPAAWGQAYGGGLRQQWSGTVSPRLEGDVYGFKVGQDLYAHVGDNGYRQQMGVYVSHSRLDADVKGFALAVEDRSVGDLKLDGDSAGAYWTLVGPQQAYLDAVVQYTALDGRARSDRGDKLNIDGHAWTASLEAGYPIQVAERWSVEPQAQLVAQKVSLDSASDSVSRISYDAQVELTGRLGVRLEGAFSGSGGRLLQPYAQLNLWHGDGGRDTLVFDNVDKVKTDYRYTSVQLETGVVAQVNQALSLHGGVQYSSNLDSRQQQASGVNLGVRWQF
ncbi:autotransporter outer membrane beta-barrel domain-containing protein [Pseudomonas sp. NC26]|uniref:Autotransporter outer membrane beta-barrel domain-containing protein n=1 Tax=Pseudomonas putida TaxID=303 RepID=A0A7W2L6D0_PSEPU|nr:MULTISPECIES: autotransporter outer membrane beta-barrel domain-containing protein [Pseudomonas]MBA6119236.1 autotransporter outer membrane beta-barrel domain-containing protein [Pseudomonas putida]MCZ9639691.1 autotransporter outer membrane beta-barrel domain-containing protein [Pseudomonas putida]MEC4878515.1 autotransporter outer membrane beta-barrel domain-containing protein [Pseudomonas sp. NC26]QNL88316.1 Autotransporter outer membrane beta-barrel domain-containing protein [Pseudomonas